jgi:uncharacterized membrane protein
MKNTLIAASLLILMALSGSAQNARNQNFLIFHNNTAEEFKACVAWFNNGKQCWVSKGWYIVAPYKDAVLDEYDFDLGSNTMYVYGESAESGYKNQGNTEFGIDEYNAFEILVADKINSKMTTRRFTSVTLHKGQNFFYFHL